MPTWLIAAWSRVRALFSARRLDADFDREMAAHLDLLAEEYVRRGMPVDAARRAARMRFGGSMQTMEQHRESRSLPFVETLRQDVRYALRTLGRQRTFAFVAVATLAIGIGAATAMFTVVNAVLLRPLPYPEPDRLVEISEVNPLKGWTHTVAAPANLADWRARNTVFTDITAYIGVDDRGASRYEVFLSGDGEPQPLKGIQVMGNLFEVLGAKPLLGRTFTFEETFEGKERVAVLAYGTWQTMFGGDPQIVGRSIVLSGKSMSIVGVMPRGFFFPSRGVQFWVPFGVKPEVFVKMRRPHWMNVVARLRPGATIGLARERMTAIAADLERTYPDTNTKMGVRIEPLHGIMAADARPTVLMLFGAVGVLFLIVCANIAGLQLGRGLGRARELAVRRALGAGRGRLVRQLLTESLVISIAGGLAGAALAAAAPWALGQLAPAALPPYAMPQVDRAVLVFAVALALAAPLAFALVPAVTASRSERLGDRSEAGSRGVTSARQLLVGCEVALAVVLAVGAALLARSLNRLEQIDPGFRPEHVLTFKVWLPRVRYPKDEDQARVFLDIERRLKTVPGVEAAGATTTLALRGYTWTGDAFVEGHAPNDFERELRHESITPDYFRAMGIRLLAGRWLAEAEGASSNVTLVNEALARKYFRGADPVGKRIKFGRPTDDDPWTTIVGVVADEKQDGMDRPARPEVYVPLAENTQNPLTYVVRSAASPEATMGAVRQQVRAVDKDLGITEIALMPDVLRDSMTDERFRTALLSLFAGLALFLAALGVYGVLAYFVSQRSRELGIRLALGARASELFRLVMGQGLRPVALGAAAGVVAALALTDVMRALVFSIEPIDPASYALALAALVAVAAAACALPAARATRVNPIAVLRDQ
jgi:putative ABC transport system permease protein